MHMNIPRRAKQRPLVSYPHGHGTARAGCRSAATRGPGLTPTHPCANRPHAANLPRGAQSKPVSYLHVGMVQHDPAGRIAFLHRTAEGKFHPFVRDFRRVHVVTVPLSPARAAATLGNRQRHMGFEKLQVGTKHQTLNPQSSGGRAGQTPAPHGQHKAAGWPAMAAGRVLGMCQLLGWSSQCYPNIVSRTCLAQMPGLARWFMASAGPPA